MQKFWAIVAIAVMALLTGRAEDKPMNSSTSKYKAAVVGGGCYWCTEAIYQMLPGVIKVRSGFAGGTAENPTYEQVCTGKTGHAEVIEIQYDPAKISYEKLLDAFWEAHDPTTLNRQGHDVGTQYRSIILYQTPEEKELAEKSKAKAQANFKDPIVTQIVPLKKFWVAEDYHQNYFRTHSSQPYCQAVIRPKVEKFEKKLKQHETSP